MSIKDPQKQIEELVNVVGLLMKNLSEINGYMQSKNILEVGNWQVKDSELVSKDGDVGMSTEDTTADDVRFWAGGATKETAPWRVSKSGKMVATGALIQSTDGTYPLIIMDPDNDLFGAYGAADKYVRLMALDGSTSTPAVVLRDGIGPITGLLYVDPSLNELNLGSNKNIRLSSTLGGYTRLDGEVRVVSWDQVVNNTTGQTLYDALLTGPI